MPTTKTIAVNVAIVATVTMTQLLAPPAVRADGAEACGLLAGEQQAHEAVATASLWANALAHRASIRAESARLLREAWAEADSAAPPAGLCPAECREPPGPEIVFRSTPRKVRSDYSAQAYCETKLRETERRPLRYFRRFASEAALEKWIQDFATGDGPDGKDLYARCDNVCSPRYTYVIQSEGGSVAVDTSVVCGHARDRNDNKFDLSYRLRWTCGASVRGAARRSFSEGGPP